MVIAATEGSGHGSGPLLLEIGVGLMVFGAFLTLGAFGYRLKDSSAAARQGSKVVGLLAVVAGIVLTVIGAVID